MLYNDMGWGERACAVYKGYEDMTDIQRAVKSGLVGLCPTAKILRTNRGNRVITLTSMASKTFGLTGMAVCQGVQGKNGCCWSLRRVT